MPSPRLVLPVLLAVLLCVVACRHTSTNRHSASHRQPTIHKKANDALSRDAMLTAKRGPAVQSIRQEPDLRIRIQRDLTAATLSSAASITVGPGGDDLGRARPYTFQAPLRVSHDRQGFILTEPSGKSVRWRLSSIEARANAGGITVGDTPYPGTIELVADRDKAGQLTGRFDAVNHVGMESYLPGVLSKELYPGWDLKAYRAQAIAARSYAIWEMNLPVRRGSHFDLEASQASQAYIGAKASAKARAAVSDTAGQVLVFERRVLPAFYSSCSGGVGQDAIAAWPKKVDDLAPLRGRNHGAWGQQSTKFRWGPIRRDRQALSRRIAAWGTVNKHPVAGLGLLTSVQVTASNSVGRPTQFRVTDSTGRSFAITCEDLRMATNFRASSLPTIDITNLVYSSHATYAISGNTVTITGQGFGHGVGMCQFGAQHMASQGHDHQKILGFYYPGARLQKAY